MRISVDGQEIFQLSDIQKKVIQNDIPSEVFDEDMKRRLQWVLVDEKYRKCLRRLKEQWISILSQRYQSLPTNDEELAQLIFDQPDYKDRSGRELEIKESQEAKLAE